MQNPNVLVTGAGGVTGKALIRIQKLYTQSLNFIFINSSDLDLRDLKQTVKFIKKKKIKYIINFAAVSGGIGLSMNHQASLLRDNVLININILEASVQCKIKKIVLCLTTGMYPEKAKIPLKEKDIHNGIPSITNYGSSFAKRLIEPAIRAYRSEFKLNAVGLIPSGIYGPEDNFNLKDAPMLPSIIAKMYHAQLHNDILQVWGTGKPLREYTYSEDVAKIFMWGLMNYNNEQVLNIGSPEEKSIKSIVYLIAKHLNFPKNKIYFNTEMPDGIFRKSASNSLFRKIKKFKYMSMEEGIKKTIEWYTNVYHQRKNLTIKTKLKVFKC